MKIFPEWMYRDPAEAAERIENIELSAQARRRAREQSTRDVHAGFREDTPARPGSISPLNGGRPRSADPLRAKPALKRIVLQLTNRARIKRLVRAAMKGQK